MEIKYYDNVNVVTNINGNWQSYFDISKSNLKRIKVKASQIVKKVKAKSENYQPKNQQLCDKDGKLPTSGGSALFDMSFFINTNRLKDDKKRK
ncbi:hypothetical protein H8356DRAFT_1320732 [Neocallimastix lanati (nom. inval.)]|nr:hypothetical protein H8356DRAFT_1320732 [Neocallimastix sp. JGI-2020a]